ncbi:MULTISPECIES: helix-turn-helix domain-containing protein [Pseudomonas putida group]|uniref:helix-turn-helix domain-containing protein n=1 Tax=Pseudomonas putida group TaxID=136845 RepID=UPI00064CAC5F|nr:helix-turn-helix domain-containing protein [Pseudomonas putida]
MGVVPKLAVGPDDAAEMTSHSRSAIYDAINSGSLRSFKSGKRRLILVRELESWLNGLAKDNSA